MCPGEEQRHWEEVQKDKEVEGKDSCGEGVWGEGANKGSSQGCASNKEVGLPSSEMTMLEPSFFLPFFILSFSNP